MTARQNRQVEILEISEPGALVSEFNADSWKNPLRYRHRVSSNQKLGSGALSSLNFKPLKQICRPQRPSDQGHISPFSPHCELPVLLSALHSN